MRKILGPAFCGLLLLSFIGRVPAGDLPDPKATVAKALKAMGGEEKRAKFKAMTWKEKGTYYGMGAGLPYTGNYTFQWPGQSRMEIVDVFTIVLNGDKGWVKAGGMTKEMDKDQLAEQKAELYAGWVGTLLPLKDKAFTLKASEPVKMPDGPANAVLVSKKGHRDVLLLFNPKSGMLIGSQYKVKAMEMDGKEVKQEVFYSDFKQVQGITVPMKVQIKRDGKLFVEGEASEMKLLEKVDNSTFAQP